MNRRRTKGKNMFPPNLYENKGYFSWRNPLTGESFGLGRDRAHAFDEAINANVHIAKLRGRPSLVERITGDRSRSVAKWEEKYQAIIAKHDLTEETRSNYRTFSRRMVAMLGSEKPLKSVTALDIGEGLERIATAEGKPRVAQALRAYMRLSLGEAISQGWIDVSPVRATRLAVPIAVKRSRLSLEVFKRVYNDAMPWLQIAMGLALTSAQRREDVSRARFADFRDGGWWCVQASKKTDHPHRIFIPLELKPAGFMSLGEVLAQSRRAGVASPYVVHQTRQQGRSKVGCRIGVDTITTRFSEGVEALQIDWGDKTPPTFHEIRSLSERLYEPQGINTQLLLGHSDPDTTALYHNSRGLDWVRITV